MPSLDPLDISRTLDSSLTQSGDTVTQLSMASPVLLVFLRHAGCTFCREAVKDIGRLRGEIEATGTRIVLVHMGDRMALETLIEKSGLSNVDRICDPGQELYRAFGLKRGTFFQVLGPKSLWRGLLRGGLRRHGLGDIAADAAQMPGVFLIENCEIVRRFRHRSVADRPDYLKLCLGDTLEAC